MINYNNRKSTFVEIYKTRPELWNTRESSVRASSGGVCGKRFTFTFFLSLSLVSCVYKCIYMYTYPLELTQMKNTLLFIACPIFLLYASHDVCPPPLLTSVMFVPSIHTIYPPSSVSYLTFSDPQVCLHLAQGSPGPHLIKGRVVNLYG